VVMHYIIRHRHTHTHTHTHTHIHTRTHTHTHSHTHKHHTPTYTAACKVQFEDEYDKIEMVRIVGADGLAEEEYNFNSEVSLGSQVCTTTVLFCSSQTGHMWLGNTIGYRAVVGGIHYHGHLIVKHSWHSF